MTVSGDQMSATVTRNPMWMEARWTEANKLSDAFITDYDGPENVFEFSE
jgi:hypothetical protein